MGWQDRLIASCVSWNEFWERTKKLSTDGQRGAVFERLTQLYLQTTPEYRAELRYVWTLREVPPDVCKRLNRRKFTDYALPPAYFPLGVVTNTGGRMGWHFKVRALGHGQLAALLATAKVISKWPLPILSSSGPGLLTYFASLPA